MHDLLEDLVSGGTERDVAAARITGLACAVMVALHDTLAAAVALALLRVARLGSPASIAAVEFDTPLLGLYRVAQADVRLGEAIVAQGDLLFVAWAAAAYQSGDARYLYGAGPHRCPAATLSDAVVASALQYASTHWDLELLHRPLFAELPHLRIPTALVCEVRSAS